MYGQAFTSKLRNLAEYISKCYQSFTGGHFQQDGALLHYILLARAMDR